MYEKIFVDLDGVLADFDTGYEKLTGVKPTRWPAPDNIDWKAVDKAQDFYLRLPLIPGARRTLGFHQQNIWTPNNPDRNTGQH